MAEVSSKELYKFKKLLKELSEKKGREYRACFR